MTTVSLPTPYPIENQFFSDVIVFNKYASYVPLELRRETWEEICARNLNMHIEKFPKLTDLLVDIYKNFVIPKKSLPSMRGLQFSGPAIKKHNFRMFNCAYSPMNSIHAFSETYLLLLAGTGKGFSVQKGHVSQLPDLVDPKKHFSYRVRDEIEGWADAIKALMGAFFGLNAMPRFDFSGIREKGALLVTSGGKAPGAKPLMLCLEQVEQVCRKAIREGKKKLHPIDVYTIICFIAESVLSGGIRRSSTICFFSIDDTEMLLAKAGNWWEEHYERRMANNSVVLELDKTTYEEWLDLWARVTKAATSFAGGSGEPGIYWTNDWETLTNPCKPLHSTILTPEGYITFKEALELEGEDLTIILPSGKEAKASKPFKTGEKRIVQKVTLNYGAPPFYGTGNHRHWVDTGYWCAIDDMKVGMYVNVMDTSDPGNFAKSRLHQITHIDRNYSVEDVYDITVYDDSHAFIDSGVVTHNCGEAGLRANTMCNLVEINGATITDATDFYMRCSAASTLNTLQASYTDFPYLRKVWKKHTDEDALTGTGITGVANGRLSNINLAEGARIVKGTNEQVARMIGINHAARTTIMKPAGTSSSVLTAEDVVGSGIHGFKAFLFNRRIRLDKTNPLYLYFKDRIPELLEDEFMKEETSAVLSIPQKLRNLEGAILEPAETALQFLNRTLHFNNEWIAPGHDRGVNRHNVSATCYLEDHEWPEVGEWLWQHRFEYHGMSFLSKDKTIYKQLPFEPIDENTYQDWVEILKRGNINLTDIIEYEDATDLTDNVACAGGVCELI